VVTITQTSLEMVSDENYYENNNAYKGGVFYVTSAGTIELRDDHYYMNNGENGRIMNSIAADFIFNISDCVVEHENFTLETMLS